MCTYLQDVCLPADLTVPGASTPGDSSLFGQMTKLWRQDESRGGAGAAPAVRALDFLLQEDRDTDMDVLQEVQDAVPGQGDVRLFCWMFAVT